jgi:hypothetical protein
VVCFKANINTNFEPMKQHLMGHKFHNKQEVETAIHKWLQMEQPNFYCNTTQKLVTAWKKCINMLKAYKENNEASVKQIRYI